MRLLPLSIEHARHVCYNAIDADRREIGALMWGGWNSDRVAAGFAACRVGFVGACDDGVPAAIVGAAESWPGVWTVGMVSTGRLREIAWDVVRRFRKLPRIILGLGATRAQAFVSADNTAGQKLLALAGARREALLDAYGSGGVDFYLYKWRPEDVHG